MRKIRSKARAVPGSQEWGTANTGTEQVGFRLQLIGGDLDGQFFTWYGFFTEASEERTLESLRIAGWDGDFANILDLPGLGSTEFEVQLEDQTDKNGAPVINQETGEPYLKPTFINRIGVAMKNVMGAQEKAAFAQRMRARYGASQSGRTPPRSSGRSGPDTTSPPPLDDDIAF